MASSDRESRASLRCTWSANPARRLEACSFAMPAKQARVASLNCGGSSNAATGVSALARRLIAFSCVGREAWPPGLVTARRKIREDYTPACACIDTRRPCAAGEFSVHQVGSSSRPDRGFRVVVQRSSSVEVAVLHDQPERFAGPVLALRLDGVEVSERRVTLPRVAARRDSGCARRDRTPASSARSRRRRRAGSLCCRARADRS